MLDLTEPKRRVLACDGHALVLGGPGSGKTTLALQKAVVRINADLAPGQSVLFLSFSRAAVARLGEAMREQVPRDRRALLSMQTFHSLFWTILSAHAYLLGAPKKLAILLPHDEHIESGSIKRRERNESNPTWVAWLEKRERLFFEEGRIAFDLFAPKAAALLAASEHVRRLVAQRHPLIIVDEAQDTDDNAWRCIELLAPLAQMVCLADLDQQIFDHLPGIGEQRVAVIRACLGPLEADLGNDNHRSGATQIAVYGNDILHRRVRVGSYDGVSTLRYNPKALDLNLVVRQALGMFQRAVRTRTGAFGRSVAILTHSGALAAKVSAALNTGSKPVRHRLAFDEDEAMLAARLAAFLLEPKKEEQHFEDAATALDLIADTKAVAARVAAERCRKWAAGFRKGRPPAAALAVAVANAVGRARNTPLSGDPGHDWTLVKRSLRDSGNADLIGVVKLLDYLVAFNRGRRISANLGNVWTRDGCYTNARDVLEAALAQDQILGGVDDPPGIQIMTIHKSKGKQFDGVIVIREGRRVEGGWFSSFVWRDDPEPYERSRRILRVAVTRARTHALILQPIFPSCPILGPHRLR